MKEITEQQKEDDNKNNEPKIEEGNNLPQSNDKENSIKNIDSQKEIDNSETSVIKPKIEKNDFEMHIINAYKRLIGIDSINNNIDENNTDENIIIKQPSKINIKQCENELRLALDYCESNKKVIIQSNIIDKISRITKHNKINLHFIMGKILISLMLKDYLFTPQNKSIDINLLITFINEVIILNSALKNTYFYNKFNKSLINFIIKIIPNYNFQTPQLNVLKQILETHNTHQKPIKIKTNSFSSMVKSISDTLISQEKDLDQYKFIYDNNETICNMISGCDISDLSDLNNLNNYLELGKILAYLEFNKKYVVFLKRQTHENELQGLIKIMFDGYDDNNHINVIEGEKFYVDYDEEIEIMRENICEILIKYVEKFIVLNTSFEFQYVLYVLIKRIYFHFRNKFKEKIEPLLAQIITNLCFFKLETVDEVKTFAKEILKSENEQDENLKKILQAKFEENKSNPNFLFKKEEENEINKGDENYFTNLNNISIETIFILENDLKIGFFKTKIIEAGETFIFYVELSQQYGILDFCMAIEDYDIKLKITNLTEGREVYSEEGVTNMYCPLKLTMFFTKPGIFQFELDNSYSWLRSKKITYKVNVFYPQSPYYIGRRIVLMKYQDIISNNKILNKNPTPQGNEKIFLVKFNGQNNSFKCSDINQSIQISNKMIQDNYIKIFSIYVDKSLKDKSKFYIIDNDDKLIEYELTQESFIDYIHQNIIQTSNANINIINLFIISGNTSIIDNHYLSIEDVLGFTPEIKNDGLNNSSKILFFMEYLHQAQLLYSLFKKINNKEEFDIVLLINYTKFSGYQIAVYNNGEIFLKIDENLEKNEDLNESIGIISKKVKEFRKEKKIDILIAENIDKEDEKNTAEKIANELSKKLGLDLSEEEEPEDTNIKLSNLSKEFNEEVSLNSHIFYLNE